MRRSLLFFTGCLGRGLGNNVQLKRRITEMTYKGDCPGLLKEYQAANAIPDESLMVYIDEHADEAGCFPKGSPHFGSSG